MATAPPATREAPRYEIKFQCSEAAFATLLFQLRTHAAGLYTPHPPRTVQSIYFDTADGRAARENITGQADRAKLRFRWYGEGRNEARGALELKIRQNALISKRRHDLPEPLRLQGASRHGLVRALRAQCPPAWRALLDEAQEPAQWIAYERHYFAARTSPVRVTVDRRLRAWDLRDRLAVAPAAAVPMPPCTIVECKAPPEYHDALQAIARSLPFSRSRCSKYVMACMPYHYLP